MANPHYDPDLPDGPHNDPGAPATVSEAIAEYADNAGIDHPDSAWLLTSYDSWVRNPHYCGPPVPHPESDYEPGEVASDRPCVALDEIPF